MRVDGNLIAPVQNLWASALVNGTYRPFIERAAIMPEIARSVWLHAVTPGRYGRLKQNQQEVRDSGYGSS